MKSKLNFIFAVFSLFGLLYSFKVLARDDASTMGLISKLSKTGDFDIGADSVEFKGSKIFMKGHIVARYKNMKVLADKAVVDINTKEIEAQEHVTFIRREVKFVEITAREYQQLKKDVRIIVTIKDYVTKATGEQKILAEVVANKAILKADYAKGNMKTGVFNFKNLIGKFGSLYFSAKSGNRSKDGVIVMENVKMSSCEYLLDNHEHYSICASKVVIYPQGHKGTFQWADILPWEKRRTEGANLKHYNLDPGEHSIWAYNCTVKIGGVPVFWSPVLYKPQDPSSLGVQVKAGYDSDWGAFLKLSKNFHFFDNPNINGKVYFDLYSKRGIGSGAKITMRTENSSSEIFGYGIKDQHPYASYGPDKDGENDAKERNRIRIHKWRGNLRLSNVYHITPGLDFRGHLELLSDFNFLEDYFKKRADRNPQPTSFGALEYQADRFSASIFVKPRLNTFFTVVERLPELRIDIPRQELFANIYYQGKTSFEYLQMKWRNYSTHRTAGNKVDPDDYDTIRIDSLHMFYYPLYLFNWLNIIPRAGMRFTDYTRSTSQNITTEDLETMFIVDTPYGNPGGDVLNYNSRGGNRFRFAAELGVEMNTKLYRSWQNIKSAFWQLDGLRHVVVPYLNYTFIPTPTVKRHDIYYFDDIDRIDRQNFIRFGVRQRLQTRRGIPGHEQIYEWAAMENYYDFHFERIHGFRRFGDFGTIFSFTPTPHISVKSRLLIDTGMSEQSEDMHREDTIKDRHSKHKHFISKFLNKWETTASYNIFKGFRIFATHRFQDSYRQRSIYSMGSDLFDITSGSSFDRNFSRWHTLSGGIEFPVPFDDNKSHITLEAEYDINAEYFREDRVKFVRMFHCWTVGIEFAQRRNRDYEGDRQTKNSVMFTVYLTQFPGAGLKVRTGR